MDLHEDLLEALARHGAVHRRDRDSRWHATLGELTATAIDLLRKDPDAALGLCIGYVGAALGDRAQFRALLCEVPVGAWPDLLELAMSNLRAGGHNIDTAALFEAARRDYPEGFRHYQREVDARSRRIRAAPGLSTAVDPPVEDQFLDREFYAERALYLAFPAEYPPYSAAASWGVPDWFHPTWPPLDPGMVAHHFGGLSTGSCNLCGGTLHHLLTTEPVPPHLGISQMERLELVACLSCVGWEAQTLFYRHDADGIPRDITPGTGGALPTFPAEPLQEVRVGLAELGSRWTPTGAVGENPHRLGGPPAWIQAPEYPRCPACYRQSQFLLQLDGGLRTQAGQSWEWGGSGRAFMFWCDHCRISSILWQDS